MTSSQVHPVPRGWQRVVAVDAVYYVSPDKRVLWNRNDVLKHLTSWGTCKCGLQCPVDVDIVFSFNQSVPTGLELPPPTGSCVHTRNHNADIKSISITATESHNLNKAASCDAGEVNAEDDGSQEMDGTHVEMLDAVTPLDLEKSDSLEDTTSSLTASRDLDQLVHLSVQEEAKSDNSSVQQETNSIEPSSCDLHENNNTQVTTVDNNNGALCDKSKFKCTSDGTTQVVNVDRSDNLLPVDNTANGNMPSFSQEEQLCNLVKPVCVQNKLSVTEKILSPNSPSHDASPNSPIATLCRGQESPSPQKVESTSLSPCESMPAVCSCVSQVKLVDYSYNGDSDNGNESINAIDNDAMDDGAVQVKKPVLDHNDSTDSISDESDSNSLVHKSGCTKFTASCETDSTELLHDSSDTGSESFIEEIDLVTNVNVKVPSLENITLSPPLMCTKTITQTSKYVPVSPILNEDVIPSIMDVKTSTEDKVMVHMVEMPPLSTSTVSTVATPSVSTEVTPSVFNVPVPHISTSATSPVFNITEPVSPVSSLPAATAVLTATTSTMSSAYSDNLPSVADKVTCLYNENLSSITSAIMFQDVSSSSKNSFVSNKETPVSSIGLHSLLASTIVNGNDGVISLNNLSPFVLPSQFEKASLPVSTAHDEVSVFASSESIPTTCPHSIPKLCAFDSVQSASIPVTSQKFSSSMNDILTITLTQASSQATPVEASRSSNENTVTIAPDYSSNGDGNQSTEPTQPTGSCQVDQQESPVSENSDDGPVATFPAALKLSIDLSVLPHKKKVLQRAKWTTLLTTPVPVLRERKRPLKPTVVVKSTVIKSNRKSTAKSSPKKQLPLSTVGSQYEIGDVLWCKFSYWDPWPCKIILHSKVSQPEPTPDQVWVEWFGDHSYSKVDRGSLTSYEEGLQKYLSSKKGKHRRKLKKAVSEVRSEVEGISTVKGSAKKKKATT